MPSCRLENDQREGKSDDCDCWEQTKSLGERKADPEPNRDPQRKSKEVGPPIQA